MAFQNIIGNRLAQAALTTSYVTVYTTPALTRTYVKSIDICNTTAGTLNLYISLVPSGGTAGTGNALYYNFSVAANSRAQWAGTQILTPGDLISVKASGAGLTVTITGGEAT
jgi:hypothetical protein